jgi:parvulin-like peptidyl-prolyl isomerase
MLDEKSSYEYHVKKLLGIKDRDFTPGEKNYYRAVAKPA